MIFAGKRQGRLEHNHWVYDAFLFMLLIVKAIYVMSSLKNRRDPNDRNQYIMLLSKNLFSVLICVLLLFLFHPFSKNPVLVWRDTKLFLFVFGVLSMFDINWYTFTASMRDVLAADDAEEHINQRLDRNTARFGGDNSHIHPTHISTVIVIVLAIAFGFMHHGAHGYSAHHILALLIVLAAIAFGVWAV